MLYAFTTENIAGYIQDFDFKDRNLATVGTSADQVINAGLFGCRDITLLDCNPYTKFYAYLKLASLFELERTEFLNYLRFQNYPKVFKKNKDVFSSAVYCKIKTTLRVLDYESYLFWDELFQTFHSITVQESLFYTIEEYKNDVILGANPYLISDIGYKEAREKLKKVNLSFINGNVFQVKLNQMYDNIWLSNIGTHSSRHFVKIMVDNMSQYLKLNGKLLISYLYGITKDTKYEQDWCPIYDLEKTFSMLEEYHPQLISFVGVDGLKSQDNGLNDSILIHKKTK